MYRTSHTAIVLAVVESGSLPPHLHAIELIPFQRDIQRMILEPLQLVVDRLILDHEFHGNPPLDLTGVGPPIQV